MSEAGPMKKYFSTREFFLGYNAKTFKKSYRFCAVQIGEFNER